MVGCTDMLEFQSPENHWKAAGLDFSAILTPSGDETGHPLRCVRAQEHELENRLDVQLLTLCKPAIDKQEPVNITMPIRNTHRTVCTTLSGEIAKRYGLSGLPEDTIRVTFKGSAGQSFGAFLAPGCPQSVPGHC